MTASPTTAGLADQRPHRLRAAGRLLRLELRRSVMLWLLPIIGGLFWLVTYRPAMGHPPLWNIRAMIMQTTASAVFVPAVVGAAAWLGARETRHGIADLLTGTARSRWFRQLVTWSAITAWSLTAYLICVAALYLATARQGAWGGPLWWPAAVGAATLPAFSALGFAAGTLRPSRLTAPLTAVAVFLTLELTAQFIHDDRSAWQVSPLVAGPWELGADPGVATFYRYLPDLPIAQITFLAGITAVFVGVLGIRPGSGSPWLRRTAAALTTTGVLAAVTATALVSTGRLDPHGMIAIPALHRSAHDQPVPYTPVCADTPIPVCLHPAYATYLPTVTTTLGPLLRELAGLPGAPIRIEQTAAAYRQEAGNGVSINRAGPASTGTPPTLHLLLPVQFGHTTTAEQTTSALKADTARDILSSVIGGGRETTAAQAAVTEAILGTPTLQPGTPEAAAAQRFAALPDQARHDWLMQHVTALRAGQLTLTDLP
ncbi:hypothetical protein [Catellatospora tritici]|uniref:hypothetical protein n=1 Tax=Catellatospora tritici TaxID=2851566 RepID=UPI001C2D6CF1|nr:hypothetical protein [Catellatospora tritici]MBV1854434.1 hypothetical protein [Catellatospora tritici]